MTKQPDKIDNISLQILWNRLRAITDEMAAVLVRTSFSPLVRESHDFACVLMDERGNALSQSSISIPSFTSLLPQATQRLLNTLPKGSISDEDIFISNDPWFGSSHLPDMTMIVPVFHENKLIGFVGSIAHLPDIGGRLWSTEAREVYEEGLRITFTKLVAAGTINEELVRILRDNVRLPDEVMGDIWAQVSANTLGCRRLLELCRDKNLGDLSTVSRAIQERGEASMREAILALPDGEYDYEVTGDGLYDEIFIRANMKVAGSDLVVDYEGSSPQSTYGLNSVLSYTFAYTVYPIKCVLDPETPNNEGCMKPVTVHAPEGSILNPRFPAPVAARHFSGHLLPIAMLGALSKIIPDRVITEGGIPPWLLHFHGADSNGNHFALSTAFSGGYGASKGKDGYPCLTFPTNSGNTPIEVIESKLPIIVEQKSIRQGSGGAGQYHGGCGQVVALKSVSQSPIRVSVFADKLKKPAQGLLGGLPGQAGAIKHNGALVQKGTGYLDLNSNDVLEIFLPGGGGYGPPHEDEIEKSATGGEGDAMQEKHTQNLDIERIRADFKVCEQLIFLDNCAVAPIPAPVEEAMIQYLGTRSRFPEGSVMEQHLRWDAVAADCKTEAARLINGDPDEIAMIVNTTQGLNAIANMIPWRQGDNVVVSDLEYPGNVVPWMNQQRHGIEVRIAASRDGCARVDDFASVADGDTAAIAVSWVQWTTGARADLDSLLELAESLNAYLVVDGVQGLGALQFDVRQTPVHFLVTGGHKWLCAPYGTGFLYCRKDLINKLEPAYLAPRNLQLAAGGIKSYEDPDFDNIGLFSNGLAENAARFDNQGSPNAPGIHGFHAALKYINDLGKEHIENRIFELREHLVKRLEQIGLAVTSPGGDKFRSGILTFEGDSSLVKSLQERRILVSPRYSAGKGGIRVSAHYYNTQQEIDHLIEVLLDLRKNPEAGN